MSDDTEKQVCDKPKKCHKWSALVFIIFCIALIAAMTFGYWQFNELQNSVAVDRAEVQKLQQGLAHSQDKQYENKKQIERQQQAVDAVVTDMGFDKAKWQLAEATYLIELANFNLTYQENVTVAIKLLSMADDLLQKVGRATLQPIQAQLTKDLYELRSLENNDLPGILLQLNNLQDQVSTLALQQPSYAHIKIEEATDNAQTGWRAHLAKSLEQLKDLVVIRYHDRPIAADQLPINQAYLREQLGLFLAQAEWAVLRNQNALYQDSLSQASRWLLKGFNLKDDAVKTFTKSLDNLQKVVVSLQRYPDLAPVIDALKHVSNHKAAEDAA